PARIRGGSKALQRAAETRLPRGDLLLAPPHDPDGIGHVARTRRAAARLGGHLLWTAIGKDSSFCRRLGFSDVRVHSRVRGNHYRLLEQLSVDDYGILQGQIGGWS